MSEIVSVRRLAVYKGDTVFKKYIDFFYNERLKFKASSDSAYTLLTKLFMNSLYGKFGQRIEDYVPIATNPDHEVGFFSEWDADEGKWIRMRKLKGNVEVFLNHVESYNSFPAIAAHVTAYARLYLYTLFHILPYGSFYYCDTDSLIVDERGLKALRNAMSGDKLGYLSLQKESAAIRINNVKDYEFNHRRKIKGVKGASKQTSYNQFTTWHQQSLKSVLWDNKQDKCLWIRTDKNLKQDYHKGIFYPGGDTLPFRFFS
ncbi:MAG: hypothetical protein GWN93_20845 [Deltaproteobacteria bacterium]|nr:hypothetical protein [Deltaproteobacteria bacterium]